MVDNMGVFVLDGEAALELERKGYRGTFIDGQAGKKLFRAIEANADKIAAILAVDMGDEFPAQDTAHTLQEIALCALNE